MSSLCTEHVVLLDGTGATWAARPRWQTGDTWRGAQRGEPLAACAALLEQAPRGRVRYLDRATVLLGFPHVQYWMLTWQAGFDREADWLGFAQATFSQQTGNDPQAWQVQVAPAGFGHDRLAVATSLDVLEALRTPFKRAALPLSRCLPLLTATLAHYRPQLPADCRLAVPEAGALGCLYMQQGAVSQVCMIASDAELPDCLFTADLLAQQHAPSTLIATHRPPVNMPSEQWLGPPHPWLLEAVP